jgi:hypothetical protein
MIADKPEGQRERRFFPNHRHGGRKVLFPDKTQVIRNIDFRRAGIAAGEKRGFTGFSLAEFFFIPDRAGRANLGAGPAETAAGLSQRNISVRVRPDPDIGFSVAVFVE